MSWLCQSDCVWDTNMLNYVHQPSPPFIDLYITEVSATHRLVGKISVVLKSL